MKTLFFASLMLLISIAGFAQQSADGIIGIWQSDGSDGAQI